MGAGAVRKGSLSGSTIAFVIHSVDRSLFTRLRNLYGISIAFVVHSLDHSLFTRLILFGHLIAPTGVVEQFLVTVL